MQFKFPLLKKEDGSHQEITELEEMLKALKQEGDGYFPINTDGLWHNGISFTDSSRSQLAIDDTVCCVADGEVVAYRLPATYKQVSIAGEEYLYSNAFTLIRHVYETPKGNILVFFSLYLNLLPYDFYDTHVLPDYLQGEKLYKVGNKANDTEAFAGDIRGIRIRHQPSGEVIALLPQGSKLSLKASNESRWKPIDTLLTATAIIKPGWVWKPELDHGENDIYRVGDKAADIEDFAANAVGLRMRDIARGRVIALLPKGTQVTLDQARDGNWRKIKSIVSGDPVLAPGWVFVAELDEIIGPVASSRYLIKNSVSDTENDIAAGVKGLRVRLAPNGRVIGLLKAGQALTLGERQGNWAKIIASEADSSAIPLYKKGWVWLAELDKKPPEKHYYRVSDNASDRADFAHSNDNNEVLTGLNMRLEPNGFLLGLLPKGSTLELGISQNQWVKIKAIHEGTPVYNTAWVWVPELNFIADNLYLVGDKAKDEEPGFAPGKVGIRMRDLPSRAIVALFPRGTQLELEPHNNRWAKVRHIKAGEALYPPAWVWKPELDAPKAVEKIYQASPQAHDTSAFAPGKTGLNMRLKPNGLIIGLLPKEVQVTLASTTTPGWNRISRMISGQPVYNLGWVWVPELDQIAASRYKVGNMAQDKEPGFAPQVTGIRMRHFLSRETLALIPQGAELELEPHAGRWAKVKSIQIQPAIYRPAWVWKPELVEVESQETNYVVGDAANDIQPDFAGSQSGLRMRTTPGGDIMALIPKGAVLEIGESQGSWGKVKNIISGNPLYADGWVWTPDLEVITSASSPNSNPDLVTITRKKINAGDSVGYAGKYRDVAVQNQQRFELQLFSSDNLPKFMSNPFEDTGGKDLLRVPAQTPLFDQVETDTGVAFEASGIALANDVFVDKDISTEKDTVGDEWLSVNGYSLSSPSEQGWVKKTATLAVTTLRWPGFHIIDTTNEVVADIEDRDILEQIYASYAINSSAPLASSVIKQVQANESQLASLSKIIIRNDAVLSGTNAAQWVKQRVAYLLKESGKTPSTRLTSELEEAQQQQLKEWSWWDDLAQKIRNFPVNRQAYYFNPVSFINNIASHPDKYIISTYPGVITLEMLQAVKRGNTLYYREILPFMNEFASKYNVNTPLRIAHFLSQIGHESSFIIRDESLKYSVSRMRSIFGRNGARTKLYTNPGYYAYFYNGRRMINNDVHLGDYVYASRLGNGNEASGDGFRFRGRGMIQLTGKNNYRLYTQQHNAISPEDPQDFVKKPDLIVDNKRYGVESAFVWWEQNNMNRAADRTFVDIANRTRMGNRIKTITRLVNGGLNGIGERTENFWKIWEIVT